MTRSQQQFIELLKAGLWGEKVDENLFREAVDWKEIIRTAKEQTVQGVICDSIGTLPPDLCPPKEILHKLMMDRTRNVQMHSLMNGTLKMVTTALEKAGIPSVLLKGQGVASNYIRPESRSCGDIDLYVGEVDFRKAVDVVSSLEGARQGIECEHHMQFELNGIEIELHKKADYMPGVRMNRDLQAWTIESLDRNFSKGMALAPATFDAFFILHHAVRHMTTGGIGFRQLCDWTMYLHKHHEQIDIDLLQKKLDTYRMTAVWQEFGRLAVNILGLPPEELPLAPARMNSSKTEKILRQIFISGNFGHADSVRKPSGSGNYLKRKWRSFRFQSQRLIKLSGIFPGYIASFSIGWLSEAFLRLVRSR